MCESTTITHTLQAHVRPNAIQEYRKQIHNDRQASHVKTPSPEGRAKSLDGDDVKDLYYY